MAAHHLPLGLSAQPLRSPPFPPRALTPWRKNNNNNKKVNWLNRFSGGDVEYNLWERYTVSLYWAFTTMTTVGFGDIVGTNREEYPAVIFGMLVGASVFGYGKPQLENVWSIVFLCLSFAEYFDI